MDIRAAEISAILKEQIKNFGTEAEVTEVGQVLSVGDGIARCYGLDKVQAGEMVEFESGVRGMALNLETDNVGVVVFGPDRGSLKADREAHRHHRGRAGRQGSARPRRRARQPHRRQGSDPGDRASPRGREGLGIIPRKSVHEPMATGLKSIDALIPVGRGQRELIIGDRQTGKTAIALDTILNQKLLNQGNDESQTLLRLCCHRPEALHGCSVREGSGRERRAGIFHHRCGHRFRSGSDAVPGVSSAAPWASSSATTECMP